MTCCFHYGCDMNNQQMKTYESDYDLEYCILNLWEDETFFSVLNWILNTDYQTNNLTYLKTAFRNALCR